MDRRLTESSNNSVVFTFGRMNPPTVGHSKLIQKVATEAKQRGSDHVVYLSQKQKAPADPLDWNYKRQIAQTMFPGVNISSDTAIRTPFEALEELGKTYNNVTMVVGDDRAEHFLERMGKYTEEYGIESFEVVSAGSRDPDAEGVAGISASKARQFAVDDDFESFAKTMSNKLSDGVKKDIFYRLRSSLGLEEDADNNNAEEYRNMGLRGHFAYSGRG